MILVFKDFLEAVKRDDTRRDLFICANAGMVRFEMQRIFDEANVLELNPHHARLERVITIGPSFAMFRVAHPFMDLPLRGLHFNAIQGLHHLDQYETGDQVKENLQAQIR